MSRREVFLGLGSNLGDRRANLTTAVELLDREFGCPHSALSSFIETRAEGFDGPDFLNGAVKYELDLEPHEILRICKDIEMRMGRSGEGIRLDGEGRRIYRSRPIDIDILLVGDLSLDTPDLVIPHPRMGERAFVMEPLKEISEVDFPFAFTRAKM